MLIETERLRLRPVSLDDADALLAIAGAWDVASMTADIPHPLTRDGLSPWLTQRNGDTRFAIERGGELIGTAGYYIHSRDASGDVAELGYFLAPAAWGMGYASEAIRAIMHFGIEDGGIQAFTSSHFAGNQRSARVLEKLGFVAKGSGSIACTSRQQLMPTITYRWQDRRLLPRRAAS